MENYDTSIYGWVNGSPVCSRDEYVFKCRGFGAIETDDELITFAKKSTWDWYDAGWHRTFTTFYLSDYALAEPKRSLTKTEFERLRYLQDKAIEAADQWEESLNWKYVATYYFADNSEEELWRNGLGEEKWVTTVYPHGD